MLTRHRGRWEWRVGVAPAPRAFLLPCALQSASPHPCHRFFIIPVASKALETVINCFSELVQGSLARPHQQFSRLF